MRPALLLLLIAVAPACSDNGNKVSTHAAFLNGAGTGLRPRLVAPVALPLGLPLVASPDKVKVTFTALELQSGDNGSGALSRADLSGCEVTFDRSLASGSQSLECAFSVDPGTYDTIRISYSATFQVLIDDAVNSLYTDPASPNLISTTPPAGGAQFVTYTIAGGPGGTAGFGIPLFPPVTIDSTTTAVSLIGDLNRSVQLTDGTAPPNLLNLGHDVQGPLTIVAVPGATGSAEFYQDQSPFSPTGDNTDQHLSVFYGPNGQPVTAITKPGTCGWNGLGFGYQFGPADVAKQTMGLYGAYLGMDPAGTIAWETPSLQGWSSANLFEIQKGAALGDQRTLLCQTTTNTPPTSGNTFAGGAPPITPSAMVPLYLWAH